MNTKQTNQVHAAVVRLFSTHTAVVKSERAEYDAMAHILKTTALNDAEIVKALRDDMLTVFGESHKDAAQIRVNIVNNARRVAFGGTKDGKAIRGKGMSVMLEAVATVSSIRELRKVLSDAVPDGLKSEGHGGKRKGKGKGKTADKNAISIPKVATRDQAFAAARKVLEFCRDTFIKPSETTLTEAVNVLVSMLK